MGRNYDKLPIVPFGEHLIQSGDLDPVYIALTKSNLDPVKLKRWMLAYWTFYHCGVASYLADSTTPDEFWARWLVAAINDEPTPFGERWPRGHERRHMRGMNSRRCWEYMRGRYGAKPEDFVDFCVPGPTSCRDVMKRVREHVQFGPWIGFKVADMTERVLRIPVDFSDSEVFMFEDPKKSALLFWRLEMGLPPLSKPRDEKHVLGLVVHFLTARLSDRKAPPHHDRPIGLQEVETILCKWKSHLNGHYPLNNDITEIRAGLRPWVPHSFTAQTFLEAVP